MRLAACVPPLPTELVVGLEECGIRTDTDLLFSSPIINIFSRLPSGTISLVEFKKYVELVAELASAPGISCLNLLRQAQQEQETMPKFPTGIPELDEIMGELHGGRVYEISGDKKSGKSSLVLHVVLRHLIQHSQSTALWMDTTGEFSFRRINELLRSFGEETGSTALERLQVSSVFNVDTAHELLDNLTSITGLNASEGLRLQCIVIDSVTPLLGPLLSAVSAQGHAILTGFMRRLKDLAQRQMLSVLIINNATLSQPSKSNSSSQAIIFKPALGPSFAFMSDATIWLCRCEDNDGDDERGSAYVAEVLRSKITRSKTWCPFRINGGKLLAVDT